jgi:predicted enzyme related to lactoylglutathione lyase
MVIMENPRIGVEIPVLNLEKAVMFYETVFGWKSEREMDPKHGVWYRYNEFASFHIFKTENARPKGLNVAIEVQDVKETLEKVKEAGGQISKEAFDAGDGDMVGKVGLFKDPTGNEMSLMSFTNRG